MDAAHICPRVNIIETTVSVASIYISSNGREGQNIGTKNDYPKTGIP